MSECLSFSVECPDCDEDMTPNRDRSLYTCDECDKTYHESDLYTF